MLYLYYQIKTNKDMLVLNQIDIKDMIELYDDNYNVYRKRYLQSQNDNDRFQMNKWLKLKKEQENLLKDMLA